MAGSQSPARRTPATPQEADLEREADRFAAGGPGIDAAPTPATPARGLRAALAGGDPLDRGVRRPVEAATGVSLSGVRVHRPGTRHPLPGRAFTIGADIVVPEGASPRSLRHEAAHVVQRSGGAHGLSDASGHRVPLGDGGLSRQELEAIQAWVDAAADEQAGVVRPWWLESPAKDGHQPLVPWPATGPRLGSQFGTQFGTATAGSHSPGGSMDTFGPSASTVCPNCHQRPSEILAARQASEERYRRKREAEQRHGRWEVSHAQEHSAFLAGPKTTLAQDIADSRSQVAAQRVMLFGEAARRSQVRRGASLKSWMGTGFLPAGSTGPGRAGALPPVFPQEVAGAWTTAYQETVVVRTLTGKNVFVPEAAALARQHFLDLYHLILPLAEYTDQEEAEREAQSVALAEAGRPKPNPCPSCHDAAPTQPRVYRASPPVAPLIRSANDALASAGSTRQWLAVLTDFERVTGVLDALALMNVPAEAEAAAGFVAARELLRGQEKLALTNSDAVRIRAVFYPKDQLLQPAPPDGPKVEIAQGIPWYFYLTHTPTKGDTNYPPGFSWTLQDVTSPGRPEVSYEPNFLENSSWEGHRRVDEPPPALFDKLDDKLVFPEGVLYWRYPDGRTASLVTTEPWSLSDWLTAIGIGLTALGIMLASAGLATPAVLTGLGVATAAFGVASTLADLLHRSELGILTDADTRRAILFIAADIVSALTLGVGRAAALAGEAAALAGRSTQMVVRLRQAAALATLADKALGATVLVTMGVDYLQQYQAIMDANLPPAERDAALKELTTSALFTGALILGPHAISGTMKHLGMTRPVAGHTAAETHAPALRPGSDAEFLSHSTQRERLPAPDAARELLAAEAVGRHQDLPSDPAYKRQVEIDKHTWREQRDGTGWCRFSAKQCYTKTQLHIGVGGAGERTSAGTTAEVAALRVELSRPPKSVRSDRSRLDWADYSFYVDRRLTAIEAALTSGTTPPPPPRTFASFVGEHPPGSVVRNEIQGSRFERRTRAAVVEELGPERAELILSQHHLSETLNPTVAEGMLTRPDSLIPDLGGTWTAVSNKSRTSFAGKGPRAVETQVVNDLLEAVAKYTGQQHVRRTGQTVHVNRVWLLYDAASVPERHRPGIRRTVDVFNQMHARSGITFEVGIF